MELFISGPYIRCAPSVVRMLHIGTLT
uniref:Uncharacterized protein n=1 Tax=Arundo donax TaxID=35708 RepID=A0A0A9FWH2_ARUDO